MQKNVHLVIKRIISAVSLFFVFAIVSFVMNLLEEVNLANGIGLIVIRILIMIN